MRRLALIALGLVLTTQTTWASSNGLLTQGSSSSGGAVSSLTTTGSSGASTLSGGVLNIPIYSSGSSGISIGTTGITGGNNGRMLYDNAGAVGEYAVTGTGTTVPLSTAPTFTTSITDPLVIGGSGVASTLTLESTSGAGSGDSIIFKTGSQTTQVAIGTTNVQYSEAVVGKAATTVAISTATFTPNLALGNMFSVTLVHASCPCTLANPTNIVAGQTGILYVIQSSTGSDTITTYGGDFKFQGGVSPTLSTAANAVDMLSYAVRDSTHIDISLVGTNYQ